MGMNNMDNYMEQMAVLCEPVFGVWRKAWITR